LTGRSSKYFQQVSSFAIKPPRKTPLTIPAIIENIWQNVDRDYHVRALCKRLLRIDKDMSAEARIQFAQWIPDGDMARLLAICPRT